MRAEKVYLGHDNSVDLLLLADGVAVNLSGVSRMTLVVNGTLVISDNSNDAAIRWAKAGYQTGEVRIFLGHQDIDPGMYNDTVFLTVYDASNTKGVVWGNIPLVVIADPEPDISVSMSPSASPSVSPSPSPSVSPST